MDIYTSFEVIAFFIALCLLAPLIGHFIAIVYDRREDGKIEKAIYRVLKIDTSSQDSSSYLRDVLLFNFFGFLIFFLIVLLPLGASNPMKWDLAFNTAMSFVTNTNWQAYSGEVSLTPLMQILAPTVQNFLSAATGICVFIALARGLRSQESKGIGNFYQDLVRSILYVLLPFAILLSLLLVNEGVVQTFQEKVVVTTIEGQSQEIPLGGVASQVAIKQLGTNGGGYYGTNSAHPLENPTPFSNFLQMLSILLLPCSLVFTFGHLINRRKHAYMIFSVMAFLFAVGLSISFWSEFNMASHMKIGNLMEGKEWRFGVGGSILWSVATTAASNGSVNAMISSMSPISGMVALFNILLGEIIFGGVGAGMYGMIIFVILTVFLSGLMVGRTPEYLNKKISANDMKLVLIALILPSCTILLGTALSLFSSHGLSAKLSGGPHGFTEVLYAWASAAGNNGSAFAGFNANSPFHNIGLGIAMFIGRYGVIIPALLLAGNFSCKKVMAESIGQMSIDNYLFAFLLISIILIVGALTFFPALLLGPLMEHLLYLKNVTF